jgi:hypothetical protein
VGDEPIQAIQPRPVELRLREPTLSPKSKTYLRFLLHGLMKFALWSEVMEISRDPLSLVQNKSAMKKTQRPAV